MEPWAMPIPPCLGGSSYSACAGAVLFLPRPEPVDSGWSADVRLARTWPLAHCVSVSPFAPSAASDDVRYSAATGGQAASPTQHPIYEYTGLVSHRQQNHSIVEE